MGAYSQVFVGSWACLSQSGQIYEVRLECIKGTEFEGYHDCSQLGRFRSLTFSNSVTRLYSSVYFARQSNVDLMEEVFEDN